ncbi:MAG: Jag N-terminal domain-containing protein [Chloroflexi bacterium]|nr:Jag N-terminal domain-containing protein [Chloroflexota bacterium]
MTSEYQEFTGKTVEEALRQARDAFGVSGLDDLDFEILTPGSRGVLGMGAEPARVIAAPRSALGGVTPRRMAAQAEPLPPVPQRPPREDRHADERPREERGHPGRGPEDRAEGRDRGPWPERGEREPGRGERHERPGRGGERGPARRPEHREQRGAVTLSEGERAEVAAARSVNVEREEVQAAEASPEALEAGREILQTLLGHLGYDVVVTVHTGETAKLDVTGEGAEKEALGALIGRKGERLSALQHLVNLLLSRRMGEWTRVLVDVEDYRGRRERQLREIALRAADRVEETGRMLQLEPMPALERRWVHLALRDRPGIATQSIGEEPNRRVVVVPREA